MQATAMNKQSNEVLYFVSDTANNKMNPPNSKINLIVHQVNTKLCRCTMTASVKLKAAVTHGLEMHRYQTILHYLCLICDDVITYNQALKSKYIVSSALSWSCFRSAIEFLSQVTLTLPFELDIVFESASHIERSQTLAGPVFTQALAHWKTKFDENFEARCVLLYLLRQLQSCQF